MKTATAGLNTHIQQEATTLAQFWKVRRTDGTLFAFTSHDQDLLIDTGDGDGELTYEAETSFKRSAIANNDLLSVDNLDVEGLLRSDKIGETELRRGLFDFAEVWVFIANYETLSDGFVRMRRGWFGEVTITPNGVFQTELRGMTQVLARVRSRVYNVECEYDLGDTGCGVPISPDVLPTGTSVAVGTTWKVPLSPPLEECRVIGMNFEGANGSTSGVGYDNISGSAFGIGQPDTRVGGQNIDTSQAPRGAGSSSSLFLDGSNDYLEWLTNPAFDISDTSEEVNLQFSFRPNAIGVNHWIFSDYTSTSNGRVFIMGVRSAANVFTFELYQSDGATLDFAIVGTTVIAVGTDYHVSVSRDSVGDWRLFVNGVQEGATATPTSTPHPNENDLRIGAIYSGGTLSTTHGWIDCVEMLVGAARWTAGFTPPTDLFVEPQTAFAYNELTENDFIVTVAGTTGNCLEIPDETIPNTHAQGGATLQAVEPWSRRIEVTAVGADARRDFTVTELTPNSGGVIEGKDFFPDDSLNGGVVFWLTGDNAGRGMEVKDFVADDGITITQDLSLFLQMPFDIAIGDIATVYRGCDKSRATCRDIFANASRFGGFPDIPGQQIFSYPNAKS